LAHIRWVFVGPWPVVTFPPRVGTWAGLLPRPWARRSARFIGTSLWSASGVSEGAAAESGGAAGGAAEGGASDGDWGGADLAAALVRFAFEELAFAGMVILQLVGCGRGEAGRDGSPAAQEIMRTT